MKQLAGSLSLAGGGRTKEAVAADLLKAFGKDVLEKAGDKGVNGKSEAAGLVSAGTDVAKGDAPMLEGLDAVIGDRDAMDVAREVLGGVLPIASFLEVDVPGFAEDCRIDLAQKTCPMEGVADFGTENRGEGVSRHEEAAVSGLAPSAALVRQPAGGGEQVDVGMVGEVARPGVEHRQDTELGADPLWIVGEVLEGGCGFAQEQVVDGALVGACQRAELGG